MYLLLDQIHKFNLVQPNDPRSYFPIDRRSTQRDVNCFYVMVLDSIEKS